ncbi:MAG TPA: LamG-like jellyroll fold domain-containing protein [Bryobacteraceae bacterium]|nr:LamG-like jellyroll fold domain-containing protein [Bryobacteraceae bacterium]
MRKLLALLLFTGRIWAYSYQASVAVPAPTSGPYSNFTFCFTVTDSTRLKSVGSGGQIQHSATRSYGSFTQTVPADFIVTSDAGHTSLLNWDIKYWDQSAGKVYACARIPTYSGATTIYATYGDSSISTWQGGAAGTAYDSNTKGAWLMGDGSTVMLADFSTTGAHATNSGATATSGSFDGAESFGGSAGASAGANQTPLQPTAALTVSCAIKLNSTSQNSFAWAVTQDYTTSRSSPFSAYALMTNDSGSSVWSFWYDAGGGTNRITYSGARDTNWHYVSGTFTSGAQALYVDSATPVATGTVTGSLSYNSTGVFTFGRNSDGSENINAQLGRCRVSSVVRSAGWIADEGANWLNPPAAGGSSLISGGASQVQIF